MILSMLRNKVIYLILVSYAWMLAILYTERQIFMVASFLLVIPFFIWGIKFYQKKRVVVEVRCNSKVCIQKEPISFSVKATNNSCFPIGTIRVELLLKHGYTDQKRREVIYLSVDSKGSSTISFSIQSQYCGPLKIKVKRAVLYDYLRLTHATVSCINGETELIIMPQETSLSVDIPRQTISELSETDEFSKRKPGNDTSEVFGIRDYIPGDRLQNIHWKLSVKKDAILVKEYSLPIHCEIGILTDFAVNIKSDDSLELADGYINTVNLLSKNLVQNNQVHFISILDQTEDEIKSMQIQEEESYYEAIQKLLSIHPYKEQNKVLSYCETMKNRASVLRLYYICSTISVMEAAILRELFTRADIKVFMLKKSVKEEQNQFMEIEKLGIKIHVISCDRLEDNLNSFILE